jgi:hypothetical protein
LCLRLSPSLYGVAAALAKDVWAVGSSDSGLAVIEHWNGTAWALVSSPSIGINDGLASVAAVSASDVSAVGAYTDASSNNVTLIEHWNGSTWSVVPSPNIGADSELIRVAASAANDVWAVGYAATAQALIEHYGYLHMQLSRETPVQRFW